MRIHRVLHLDDLHESRPHLVVLDDQRILLTKMNGEPHAVTDVCPHGGGSLSEGAITYGCVTCPTHLRRYSLHDGTKQGRGGGSDRLLVYATRLTADGWVEVEVPDRG